MANITQSSFVHCSPSLHIQIPPNTWQSPLVLLSAISFSSAFHDLLLAYWICDTFGEHFTSWWALWLVDVSGSQWFWVGSELQDGGTPATFVLDVSLLDCSYLRMITGKGSILPDWSWPSYLCILVYTVFFPFESTLWWIEGWGCHLCHGWWGSGKLSYCFFLHCPRSNMAVSHLRTSV